MSQLVRATYRVQLTREFGFADAEAIVPYLAELGISHLYLSPCFEATSGSTHGYDVTDPNRLREELGGEAAFWRLVETAHEHALGLVIDIVPHHMAASAANAWWWSVLERGENSPYAKHFDIDWDPPEARLRGLVLLPVLGDHYGRVLEAGELALAVQDEEIVVRYYEHTAPLSPETAVELWAEAGRRHGDIDGVIDEVNKDVDRLDALLDRQHHRFARWQAAATEVDYRRFFNIDTLVALRSERPAVFDDTHRLIAELVRRGAVDGLRVDHVDGLRDPLAYLNRLRSIAPDTWLTVEKILRGDERIPDVWPVDGTTGYDALAEINALFVEPAGVETLVAAYGEFTGDTTRYDETSVQCRREVTMDELRADLERVVQLALLVCEHNRRWRDFTRAELRDALIEVCAHASAYRAYVRPGTPPSPADEEFVSRAIDGARRARPELDPDLVEFLCEVMLGRVPGDDAAELVDRVQQLTGPIAAKGEEDTAFYRWLPLLSLNEVGAQPDRPTLTVAEYHERNAVRQARWPSSMTTTATHDTKRGEDVRARLGVLSEHAHEWNATVRRWSTRNERYRDSALDAPDRRDEWFIYQTLVGAHPLPLERAWTVIEKSMREAKRRTSWTRVDDAYEGATRAFLEGLLDDEEFMADLDAEVARLRDAGLANAMAQVALRLLAPGVPDTYQGTELWDSSLVDPDNRRPVDYDARRRALDATSATTVEALWDAQRETGLPKFALLRACLGLRRRRADAFGPAGGYHPLAVAGGDDRVIAFARGETVAVAVSRWNLHGHPDTASIELPPGRWTNVLTGRAHEGRVLFGDLRGGAPLAVLERDDDPIV